MKLCDFHKSQLKSALLQEGLDPNLHTDRYYQAEALVYANVVDKYKAYVVQAPADDCPCCRFQLPRVQQWLLQAAKSIKGEHVNENAHNLR